MADTETTTKAPEIDPYTAWEADADAKLAQIVTDAPEAEETEEKAEEEPEQEPGETESEEAPEEEEEVKAERSPDAVKALANLKALGIPERILSDLTDDEAKSFWASREKSEKDVKKTFQELAELRRKLGEPQATTEAEPKAGPTVKVDLPDLREALTEQFGDEAAETFTGAIAPIHDRVERIAHGIPIVAELVNDLALRAVKADLRERFPGIDASWSDVTTRFRELSESQLHRDKKGMERYRALLEDATRMAGVKEGEGSSSNPAPAQPKKAKTVATPPRRSTPNTKGMSDEEILDAKIAYIQENPGVPAEKVRQLFGG